MKINRQSYFYKAIRPLSWMRAIIPILHIARNLFPIIRSLGKRCWFLLSENCQNVMNFRSVLPLLQRVDHTIASNAGRAGEKGNSGKFLTTDYLMFSEPEALKKLGGTEKYRIEDVSY